MAVAKRTPVHRRLLASLNNPRHAGAQAALGLVLILGAAALLLPTGPFAKDGRANYDHPTKKPLKGWSDQRLSRQPGESDLELAARLTAVVGGAIFHCDLDEAPNLAGSLASRLSALGGDHQGLLSPALLRCGYCHQVSFVLAQALKNEGIRAKPWGLNGHVVTKFLVDGQRYVTDADLGVGPVPYGPELWSRAKPDYEAIPWVDDGLLDTMQSIMGRLDDDRDYYSLAYLAGVEERQLALYRSILAASFLAGLAGVILVGAALANLIRRTRGQALA